MFSFFRCAWSHEKLAFESVGGPKGSPICEPRRRVENEWILFGLLSSAAPVQHHSKCTGSWPAQPTKTEQQLYYSGSFTTVEDALFLRDLFPRTISMQNTTHSPHLTVMNKTRYFPTAINVVSDFAWRVWGGSIDNIVCVLGVSKYKHFFEGWGVDLKKTLARVKMFRATGGCQQTIPAIHWEGGWTEVPAEIAPSLKTLLSPVGLLFFAVSWLRKTFTPGHPAKFKTLLVRDGCFESPAADILPEGARQVHFRIVLPKVDGEPQPNNGLAWTGDLVINFAATGDQGYSLRQMWYANPLASMHGVGSILPVQSFYGKRTPTGQAGNALVYRSVQQGVAMGAASVEEGCSLLRWLEATPEFSGNVCVTGVSLGGCIAVMLAGAWQKKIAVAPLIATFSPGLAWKADGGVMGHNVAWDVLRESKPDLPEDLRWLLLSSDSFDSFSSKKRTAKKIDLDPLASRATVDAAAAEQPKTAWASRLIERLLNFSSSAAHTPKPVCPHAIVTVSARHDGYMPFEGSRRLHEHFGPESSLVTVPGGHITAFLLHHATFHRAILTSLSNLKDRAWRDDTSPTLQGNASTDIKTWGA